MCASITNKPRHAKIGLKVEGARHLRTVQVESAAMDVFECITLNSPPGGALPFTAVRVW